ncbi:hypothetical protein H4S04_008405, partial [Coemansia sp. S16]
SLEYVIDNGAQKYTKAVDIHVKYSDLMDGTAFYVMDSPTFSNETFENVKCITIHILVDGNIVLPDETESNTNAALFVEKLNQLFPNAS